MPVVVASMDDRIVTDVISWITRELGCDRTATAVRVELVEIPEMTTRFLMVIRQMAFTDLQEQRGRFASRRARHVMAWQPLRVLTCQVVPAGWRFLVGCSCGNLSFWNGNPAGGRHRPPGTAGAFRFEAGCQVAAPPFAHLSG
jgi:hypothetical protein